MWLCADLAEIDEREPPLLVDHGVQRQGAAQHPHDLELLLVQRIAFEHAVLGLGMRHEARAVEGRDGVLVGDAGRDHLAAAGVARHEMRLDQAGRDPQVRLDEAPVELDRRAPGRRRAEIDMRRIVTREVVLDPDRLQDPGVADQLLELGALVRPVQAGRDQDRDGVGRHARIEQLRGP